MTKSKMQNLIFIIVLIYNGWLVEFTALWKMDYQLRKTAKICWIEVWMDFEAKREKHNYW